MRTFTVDFLPCVSPVLTDGGGLKHDYGTWVTAVEAFPPSSPTGAD